jgi:chloramphenicol-sensitive protein RarD
MTDQDKRAGFMATTCAYFIWGSLPLYFALVGFAPPWEVLAQRVLWSVPFAAVAAALMGGFRQTWDAVRKPGIFRALMLSSTLIAVNWGAYVWAIANHHVIEASIAYFVTPLVSVGFGVLFFKETITRVQIASLALAAAGVALQAITLGAVPWVALVMCASWSFYALVRKKAPVPAAGGLLTETLILAPIAAAALVLLARGPGLATSTPGELALLSLSGAVTATPLILFAFGARRLTFSTLGLLQFIAPTLQLFIGIAQGEVVTPVRMAGFVLIWIGLGAFSWEAFVRDRRSAAARAEVVPRAAQAGLGAGKESAEA